MLDEQVERLLCVRLNEFELRERVLESLDVVAVLHFVESILCFALGIVALARVVHDVLVGARAAFDRQQCVHRARDRDERPLDLAGRRHCRDLRGNRRILRHAREIVIAAGSRDVVRSAGIRHPCRVEALLPLTLRDFPELRPIQSPERRGPADDVGRIAGGPNGLRGLAVGIEA